MNFLRAVLDLLSQVNPNVAAALVTASVALVGYVYTQRGTQARAIADAHRPQKIEVYEHFLWIVRSIQYSVTGEGVKKKRTQKESEELNNRYREFTRGLIEWGSPAVIKRVQGVSQEGEARWKDSCLCNGRHDRRHS